MMERQVTTMGGNPITLLGNEVTVGDQAPGFIVLDNDLLPKTLEDYQGKIKLISVVPSLDTNVCDMQTRRFNQEAGGFSENIAILTISMDLPFAQKRWCGSAGIEGIETLSDHRWGSFGEGYGVLIKELRLLNRSIFIIDQDNRIQYIELVKENHDHPAYAKAIDVLKTISS